MGKFVFGGLCALALLGAALYVFVERGYVWMRADMKPSQVESTLAMRALDSSSERHGPRQASPVLPTAANLMEAVKLYRNHCAMCHGEPNEASAKLGVFYPRAPQFAKEPPTDMSENQDFYIIKHGVRWSGMPAWEDKLTDQQIWELAAFLRHLENLPPAVEHEWKKLAASGTPGAAAGADSSH